MTHFLLTSLGPKSFPCRIITYSGYICVPVYLNTGGVVIDDIEDVDETEENSDEEPHPPGYYLK